MTKEQKTKKELGIQSKLYENVSYKLTDKYGNTKSCFK